MNPDCIRLVVVVGGLIVMGVGIWFVHARLKAKNQGYGPNSLKALGLVLLVPSLIVIPIALPEFKSETLAALLGTVAGYALSHSKSEDN